MRGWVLVTGAGRRLGREVAVAAAQAGWGVVAHYNNSSDATHDLVAQFKRDGAPAVAVRADLDAPADLATLLARAASEVGTHLSGLVNSASRFEWDDLGTLSLGALERHSRTNLFAPAMLARDLVGQIPSGHEGSIVNVLDFKLRNPSPDHVSYTLSKYALAGLTKVLSRQLAPHVRVNAVSPGYMLPAPGQSDEEFAARAARTPLRRPALATDVASAVVFLLSNGSVTGQVLTVDAGLHFHSLDKDIGMA